MAEIGKSKGADPSEWYATFSPLSINNLDIEKQHQTQTQIETGERGHYTWVRLALRQAGSG